MAAQELGWECLVDRLDRARHEHHVSVRAAAAIAGVPPSTVQGWLNGRHVPTPALRENFTRLLDALELSNEFPADLWIRPIIVRQSLHDVRVPYLGLRAFGVDDVDLFRGREQAADALAGRVLGCPPDAASSPWSASPAAGSRPCSARGSWQAPV